MVKPVSGDVSIVFMNANVVGVGVHADVLTLTAINWEGVLSEDSYERIYHDREAEVILTLGKYYYRAVFSAIYPRSECANFVHLTGMLRSSQWHKLEHKDIPRVEFPDGEIFLPLVNVNCVKNSKLHRRVQYVVESVESGKPADGQGDSPYYARVQDGILGICYNALSIF